MMRVIAWASWAIVLGAGCGAAPQLRAPATLVLTADGVGAVDTDGDPGYGVTGALGFEATECCSAGTYLSYLVMNKEPAEKGGWDRIIDGGIELGGVLPVWEHRIRLRVRAGMAGTPPDTATLGREGFVGSAAALIRIHDPAPPMVGEAAPAIDLVLGYSMWSLGAMRTSAGTLLGDELRAQDVSGGTFLFGLRLGGSYGIDLK